jgi:phosphoglycerol transferase MdoB-like AlkP superfamily enzyme
MLSIVLIFIKNLKGVILMGLKPIKGRLLFLLIILALVLTLFVYNIVKATHHNNDDESIETIVTTSAADKEYWNKVSLSSHITSELTFAYSFGKIKSKCYKTDVVTYHEINNDRAKSGIGYTASGKCYFRSDYGDEFSANFDATGPCDENGSPGSPYDLYINGEKVG